MKRAMLLALKVFFVLLLLASAYYLLKEIPVRQPGWKYTDKLQHASLFFVLTLLALFLFKPYRLAMVFLLLCHGGVTEYLQSAMTKTRTGSIADWLADLAGVCLACVVAWVITYLTKRPQN